jgi:hypothetical protein
MAFGLDLLGSAKKLLDSEDETKLTRLIEDLCLRGCLSGVRPGRQSVQEKPAKPASLAIPRQVSSPPPEYTSSTDQCLKEALARLGNRGALIDEADRGRTPEGTRKRLNIPETEAGRMAWRRLLGHFSVTEQQLFPHLYPRY